MSCNHKIDLAYWAVEGDSIPGQAMPFCYECCYCGKTLHQIWIEEGQPYAEAVKDGIYPKESPIPLRRLTKADIAEMERKQNRRRTR